MAANIVTLEDLQALKSDLLIEIEKLLSKRQPVERKWLRSAEIRKLLGISKGTLFTLRSTGKLPFTRIGSVFFYDLDDVQKMIDINKTNRNFPSPKNNPWRHV